MTRCMVATFSRPPLGVGQHRRTCYCMMATTVLFVIVEIQMMMMATNDYEPLCMALPSSWNETWQTSYD